MAHHERKCIVCGNTYEYCPHCNQTPEHWRMIYCSENCKEIQNIFSDYKFKKITKDDALTRLASCDVSSKDNFREEIKELLNQPQTVIETEEEVVTTPKRTRKNRYSKSTATSEIVNEI